MSRCSMHIVKGKKQVDAGIRESFSTGHMDVLHLKWIHGTCIRAILHGAAPRTEAFYSTMPVSRTKNLNSLRWNIYNRTPRFPVYARNDAILRCPIFEWNIFKRGKRDGRH